jgi:predicted phage terminase large subunit-like protein
MTTCKTSWASSPKLQAMALLKTEALAARTDVNRFIEFCLRTPEGDRLQQAPLHRELQCYLDRSPRALVELPRDHGKSTQICARLAWELGRNPSLRVKLVAASEAIALERGRFLRDLLLLPRVRLAFPELQPSRPWAAGSFSLQRLGSAIGPTVACFGVGSTSTGTRADLLVCDDIVDVRSAFSKAERDRVSEEFFNNLLNLLEPDGRFWALCTPWHADDLNARLKKSAAYTLFRRAIDGDCTPVWPERWPREALQQRRAEIGSAAFARGYRLTPICEEEILIPPQWVQCWRDALPWERVVLSVDPAVGTSPHADGSALVVLGLAGGIVHVLAAVSRRVAAPQLLELIHTFDRDWQPEAILFEANGGFEAVKDLLQNHPHYGFKVKGIKQSKAKVSRIAALAVRVETGRVMLHETHRDLFDEMTSFPFGERDDLVDATATGVAELLNGPGEPRMWIF